MTAPHTAAPMLQVFAKEPIAGQVKTRLATDIGDERAAAVYRELTWQMLRHAHDARVAQTIARIELWCASHPESAWFRDLAAFADAATFLQAGDDLGLRMSAAIGDGLTRAPRVLLVGTDCPTLDAPYLQRAADALVTHDVVLGPAEDGGFVLIGARCPVRLDHVRWSTADTFSDTINALQRAGLQTTTLSPLWDVDDVRDLRRWESLRDPVTG